MCLQESSSEFEVVNMEEKMLSETQTVSFRDVRKSWAAAVTQLHVYELVCIFLDYCSVSNILYSVILCCGCKSCDRFQSV